MRAVIADGKGGPEVLKVVDLPVPKPGPGQLLIKVRAAGVNRADVMQRQGLYDPPDGNAVLGLEVSGEVAGHGPGVTAPPIGTKVVALVASGGYSEYVAAPAGQVAPAPEGVDLVDAGGIIEVAATVWSNVFMIGQLQKGQSFLLHGGASGIGTMALQLARVAGARIATTVGSDSKVKIARALGADLVINYREEAFEEVLADHGFVPDLILDVVGAAYLRRNVEILGVGGRLVVIGLQGGQLGEMPIGNLLYKQGSVHATSLRARTLEEKRSIVRATTDALWPLLASGTVRPVIAHRHRLAEVSEAHRAIEDPEHIGKELLVVH
ncbi:NAD(P)H-quinone oxidoreductase [Micromonospora sp. NPDC005206]|uniref:NAD(P)H-quinone oxidoreductase n=1 Tax=Micromonospora sp. NPDC005206 TaxID=3157022 RepID=UPI0033ACBC8C